MGQIKIRNFIDGQWREDAGCGETPLYNPSTGEQIGVVPMSDENTSRAAVESAAKAYEK